MSTSQKTTFFCRSRKCLDPGGKQLVFFVKKGTDTSVLWKATVKIACVKVDPITRKIDNYKFLNLKQFLSVFKTFQTNLHSLVSAEAQSGESASMMMMISLPSNLSSPTNSNCSSPDEPWNECSICMDRKMDVLLPCAHSFCTPCIEQWNESNKSCPICCEELKNTDESWVMTGKPGVDEISDNICKEFMSLGKNEIDE